jgi:hypothetical protein
VVTQPWRVAAISLAQRVAEERGAAVTGRPVGAGGEDEEDAAVFEEAPGAAAAGAGAGVGATFGG